MAVKQEGGDDSLDDLDLFRGSINWIEPFLNVGATAEVFSAPVEVFSAPVEVFSPQVEVFSPQVEVFSPQVEVFSAQVEAFSPPVEVRPSPVEVRPSPVEVRPSPVTVRRGRRFSTDGSAMMPGKEPSLILPITAVNRGSRFVTEAGDLWKEL